MPTQKRTIPTASQFPFDEKIIFMSPEDGRPLSARAYGSKAPLSEQCTLRIETATSRQGNIAQAVRLAELMYLFKSNLHEKVTELSTEDGADYNDTYSKLINRLRLDN